MAYVVVEGIGSYSAGGTLFRAGRTECSDEATLLEVQSAGLDWVHVEAVAGGPVGPHEAPVTEGPLTTEDLQGDGAEEADEPKLEVVPDAPEPLELPKGAQVDDVEPEAEVQDVEPEPKPAPKRSRARSSKKG